MTRLVLVATVALSLWFLAGLAVGLVLGAAKAACRAAAMSAPSHATRSPQGAEVDGADIGAARLLHPSNASGADPFELPARVDPTDPRSVPAWLN